MKPDNFLKEIIIEFNELKKLADKAIVQVSDKSFFTVIDNEANSIAILVKHMAGNMRSRWTDFLNTDGEKPDRNRDMEFIIDNDNSRDSLMDKWEAGWCLLFKVLNNLEPQDLDKTITIRTMPWKVYSALHRQLTHYAYHIGQITLLAKYFTGVNWQTLSVPRGKSKEFNITQESKPEKKMRDKGTN